MKLKDAFKADYKQLLVVCAAFLIMALFSYNYASYVIKKQIDLFSRSEMTVYQNTLKSLILAHEAALRHATASIVRAIENGTTPDEIQDILKLWTQVFHEQKDIKDVFVSVYGYLDGNYLDGTSWIPGEFYNPKTAPWLRGAIMQSDIYHTKPYIDPRTGNAVSAVSMVVFDSKGESHGVLSIDFLLNPIIEQVNDYRVSGAGYGMLLDSSFNVLTYPDQSYIGKDLKDLPGFSGVAEKIRTIGDRILIEAINTNNSNHIGFFSSLENGWYLGIIAPEVFYYREVFRMIPVIAILSLALALILCLILLRLSVARMRSEEKSESKSSFLARMSHEIRTPMNAIIGMTEIVLRDYGKPHVIEYIKHIKKAGSDLLLIINDILDFSKIESGNLTLVEEPYKTTDLFNDTLSIFNIRLDNKPLSLSVEMDPNIPVEMKGDMLRVRQILINLLSNAIKYTDKGFIKLSVLTEPIEKSKIILTISVEDSGIGISTENLKKLFTEFVRLDHLHSHHIEGTGLGLTIARNLTNSMGGELTVQSEYGKGSIFTATIIQSIVDRTPLGEFKTENNLDNKESLVATQLTAPGLKIMVVDDLETNLLVVKGLLEPYQVLVTTCKSGPEALELSIREDFDLIFIDHMMPGMDGIETLNNIRQSERLKKTTIIALTANAVSGMKEMFLENGFNDYLSKPIDIVKLNEVLDKWVAPHRKLVINTPPPSTYVADFPAIDDLDTQRGLELSGGRKGAYLETLRIFCMDANEQMAHLEILFQTKNEIDFTIRIHALKSALSNIGATTMSGWAAMLEKAGKNKDFKIIGSQFPDFSKTLLKLIKDIQNLLDNQEKNQIVEKTISPELLRNLTKALEIRDMMTIDHLLAEIVEQPLGKEIRTQISSISDHILLSEFKEAKDALEIMERELDQNH